MKTVATPEGQTMDELHDDFQPGERPRPSLAGKGGWGGGLVALLVLAIAGVGVWRYMQRPQKAEPAPVPADIAPAPVAEEPPAVSPAEGDALLKELFGHLSPQLSAWLEKGLIRPLAAAINLVADGESPAPVVPFLAPQGEFKIRKQRRKLYLDPKSYARYDAVVRVATRVDGASAARAYIKVKPFLEAAFAEVADPGRTLDEAVQQSIERFLSVKVPRGKIELKPEGLVYAYADPKLEEKTAAEKQLMRMGPKNVRAIQKRLREFQAALQNPESP
jgi:hypothetical protein